MRLLDGDGQRSLFNVQMYLGVDEAKAMIKALEALLKNPEENEHEHVIAVDGLREVSVSLVTPSKLRDLSHYSPAERRMFEEE